MCGIVGIVRQGRAPVDGDEVDRMAGTLVHRGPDEGGRFVTAGAALGVRRLSIIDLRTGTQPIANEDGSIWTVQNGEIYNFRALRVELEAKGHVFRTRSDTECIVHAYEEYGDDCVRHLRGMFAFGVWDERAQRLLLARDRLGKKPLVYAHIAGALYFASELQALVLRDNVPRDIDLGALGDYLAYGYVPSPATIYQAIRKLPPGHRLVWEDGRVRVSRYWSLEYQPKLQLAEDEALQQLEAKLDEAVRIRLVADVPIGALLSGGVDSSTVVALMARHVPQVKTFSIGFDEGAYDELAHARRVAERYSTDHHEFIVHADATTVLPTIVRHYGEPYADSSAIPTYYVTKLARQHVTVALNGDGGDEDFGGYDRYRAMTWSDAVHRAPGGALLLAAARLAAERLPPLPGSTVARARRFLSAAVLPAAARYARWMATLPAELLDELLADDVREQVAVERSYAVERAYESGNGLHPVDRAILTDVASYLPYDLLVKMDIASMANSLETRSPFLDHEVVEFTARLPTHLKLRGGREQKYLLKRLARRLVPAENIERPKMGFGVPVGAWLRGSLREMAEDALLGRRSRERGYFRPEVVRRIWDEHRSGAQDRTYVLWTLLMLELWHREFVDVPAVTAAT